jgi:Protein of unknown function (DUF1364)
MSAIRKSARGQDCTVRIPGVCNFDPATTVLAHINGGGGMKSGDNEGAYCCHDCHSVVDGRAKSIHDPNLIKLWHFEGVMRTQKILIANGLMVIK